MLRIFKKTLVIISSLASNMFENTSYGCMKYVRVQSEEKLKEIINSYDKAVSYIRHPATVAYLKSLRADIEFVSDPMAVYKYAGEDLLTIGLSKRPPKEGAVDVEVKGFEDLAMMWWYEVPCL